MIRKGLLALAGAGVITVVVPMALLMPGKAGPAVKTEPTAVPLVAPNAPPLAAVYERPLFGAVPQTEAQTPADAPALIGIVGRLGEDAVALVKTAEGATRALKVGDSVDGWNLASLAIDAAFFTRGTERVRVPLPAG